MEPAPHISWFVVITRWGQWKKISERLTALRIRHFIPSSYNTLVFFRTEKKRALDLVNAGEVKGRFIVDHGTRAILEVPDKQMEDFIRVCEAHHEDTMVHRLDEVELLKGTRVRVSGGQLDGVEGVVAKVKGFRSKRLIITVQNVLTVSAPVNNQTFIKLLPTL
jgi:transcription antitermination factor NusG